MIGVLSCKKCQCFVLGGGAAKLDLYIGRWSTAINDLHRGN